MGNLRKLRDLAEIVRGRFEIVRGEAMVTSKYRGPSYIEWDEKANLDNKQIDKAQSWINIKEFLPTLDTTDEH